MKYDIIVFVGRFQIFHMRHLACMLEGLKRADKLVVLIGSANVARSVRQPFTYDERKNVIIESLIETGEDVSRVEFCPIEDRLYDDDAWLRDVKYAVSQAEGQPAAGNLYNKKTALIGYEKDHTGYFLRMFPEWELIPVKGDNTSSSYMRNMYFSNIGQMWAKSCDDHLVTQSVRNFLVTFMDCPEYKELYKEQECIMAFAKKYGSLNGICFNTSDVLITHGKKVLLTKRTDFPGRNLWSLPSNSLLPNQTIIGAAREKINEYGLKPIGFSTAHVFDNPERDSRGRFIAHVHHVKLNGSWKLPEVVNAQWWKLSEIVSSLMFSDHKNIIDTFFGVEMTTTVLNVNSFKNEVISYRSFTFSGGEIQVRVDTPLTPPKAVLIDANIRNASEIIEMLLVTDALKEALPVSTMFHLRCRYLPYARQDRVCSVGEAFSLRMMGDLINIQEYTSVTVWDVHSPVAKIGKSDWHGIKNLVNVTVSEMITKEVIGNSILVSPDKGAIDRVSGVANKFNRPMIVAEKIRDPNDGKITGTKICDEDRARINSGEIKTDGGFLMIDDICDGGRTFIELAKVLRPMTTGKTRLYVTHGIFSQGFAVFENLVDEIITPNCFRDLDGETLQRVGYDLAQLNLTVTLV